LVTNLKDECNVMAKTVYTDFIFDLKENFKILN
jgi:hypothetical protein